MSRPELCWVAVLALLGLASCDQLGNPEQYVTGPTAWKDSRGHLVTTTRSFKDEKTIRRLLSEGMDDLDYTDPSIGPSQTLTLVFVAPQKNVRTRRRKLELVTIFKLSGRAPVMRRWSASTRSPQWSAAFALPAPPIDAITTVAP